MHFSVATKHWCSRLTRDLLACASPAHRPPCLFAPADAARSALGVLVRSAHLLPPALAERLVFSMGQCSMTGGCQVLSVPAVPGIGSTPALCCPARRQPMASGALLGWLEQHCVEAAQRCCTPRPACPAESARNLASAVAASKAPGSLSDPAVR